MAQFTKKQLKRTLIATIVLCVIVAGLVLGVFLKSYLGKTNLLKDQDFAAALADKLGVSVRGLSQEMLDKYQYCRLSFSAYDQTNGPTGYSYLILGDETYAEAMLANNNSSDEEAEEISAEASAAENSAVESAEESSAPYTEENYIVLFNVIPAYAEDYAAFRNLKVLSVLDSYDLSQIAYDVWYANYVSYYSTGSQLGWNSDDFIDALSLKKIDDLTVFSELKDLRYLSLGKSSLKSIAGLDKLTSLEYLDVSYTNVSAIETGSPALKTVLAANAAVENISGLASCPALEIVALDTNKVTDLSALSALDGLKVVSVSGNKIKSLSPLSGHAKLETLSVGDNELEDIAAISTLTALKSLTLSGTKIASLPDLSSLKALESLDLSESEFTDISGIAGLEKLKTLNAASSKITSLPDLSSLKALESLDVSGCELTEIKAFGSLENLKTVNVSGNKLTALPDINGLKELTSFNAGKNQIASLPAVSGLQKVTTLNFSENKLTKAEFEKLPALTSLNLSKNELTDISGIKELDKVTTVDLTDNKLTSFEALLSLKTLTSVKLANNEIASLPATDIKVKDGDKELPPLNAVTTADFSGNKLGNSTIEGVKTYFKVDGLTQLDLTGNGITDADSVIKYYTKATVKITDPEPVETSDTESSADDASAEASEE